jgi:hypothetical protein
MKMLPVWVVRIGSLVTLVGCGVPAAVTPLSDNASHVQIAKSDPPAGATLVAPIEVEHGSGCGGFGRKGTLEGVMNEAREEAARKGADYVEIMTLIEPHSENGCFDQTFKIKGMAFKLGASNKKVANAPAAPASQPVGANDGCNPICSPGFACVSGACVPQCNPACTPGQKCGQDRTCVAAPEGG